MVSFVAAKVITKPTVLTREGDKLLKTTGDHLLTHAWIAFTSKDNGSLMNSEVTHTFQGPKRVGEEEEEEEEDGFYSLQWKTWAGCLIQVAWRRYIFKVAGENSHWQGAVGSKDV
ncbi:hypothetical protein RIF29_39411 [Crotalaria pallida]|uniref:Uncharacterized protein n=1 Tax=Crotalaria pallida TaxID=3830 RepID=A0AAN9E3L5_CROPI